MTHPTRRGRTRTALVAAVVAVLAAPATALAAPSVFEQTAKVVPAGQTPDATWTPSTLTDQSQYLVAQNGFSLALVESNGTTSGGVLTYDVLPSAYRQLFAPARWIAEAASGAQAHATCDVAALNATSVVLSWQGSEPAYGYIPFQATSAGLGDDPATWLPAVKTATGLTLTPSTDLAAACAGIGGTFVAADTVRTTPTSLAAGTAAPLQARLNELTAAKAAADVEVARLTLEATTFSITVPSSATLQRGLEVNVTGPPNRPVFVRVQVTEAQRKALKLRYRTLGVGAGATDAKGKALVVVAPRRDTAKVLLSQVQAVPVTVAAVSGDRAATLALDLGA